MKLLECTGPIDKKAAHVIKKARPEDVWLPKPKLAAHIAFSENVLATKPIPAAAQHMARVIGQRRGTFTVVGYAAQQNKNQQAKWVVRCDCGNYEHRTRILRWLGTEAEDQCRECHLRGYLLKPGYQPAKPPAKRSTVGES